ncbi:iron ABC transporter permease [Saccharomonospora sp. CUA-673]|nr:iron ABC transporter permease [Saccharomonospora sp. CUA-673]
MVVPVAYLVLGAFDRGPGLVVSQVFRERTLDVLLRTVTLATAVTVACLLIGVAAAWLVVRSDLPFRGVFAVLFTLPLAIPSYVAGFTWISEWPGLAGFSGAFLVLTLVSYPYVLLPVMAALRSSDPGLEEVSRSLGKGPVRTFFLVTLRQARPAALAGGLLVALYVLGDFGGVSIMRYETFTMGIYTSYRGSFDRTPAAVLGCVLVLLAVVITIAERRARGRAAAFGQARVGAGAAREPDTVPLRRARPAALVGSGALLAAAVGMPIFTLTRWMVTGSSTEVDVGRLVSATVTTLQVSALGAALTVLLALPVGVLAIRYQGRLSRGVELASFAGYALPGITVGLALVFLGIRLLPGLYQQMPMLVFAYGVLFLPLAIGAVRTGIAAAPVRLEEVSRSLGKGRLITRLRVTLPLAAPGVAAGAALVFLTAAKELPATLLLRPTGSSTLATELWTLTDVVAYGAAAPYGAALIVIAAVPSVVLGHVLRTRGSVVGTER